MCTGLQFGGDDKVVEMDGVMVYNNENVLANTDGMAKMVSFMLRLLYHAHKKLWN